MTDDATLIRCCLRPTYRILGWVCTVLFAVVGIASVWAAYWNTDNSFARPLVAVILFGLLYSFFVSLGFWLLALSYRYRLVIDRDVVYQRGVLREQTMALKSIEQVTWRRRPANGSVWLTGRGDVLKIDFQNFTVQQRDQLVRILHEMLASDQQAGWDAYCEKFAETPDRHARSRRYRRRMVWLFGIHSIVFTAFGIGGFGGQFVVVAIVNALMAVYLYHGLQSTAVAASDDLMER
ncbi:MAG: hypothetical protein HKN47_22260 [Pirellulaceae bacterium]|nr:hypothetical protein [Pirellulaceae bacterium]